MADPSNPMPSANSPSSSAGATATDFRNPSTSVNHSRTKRTSRSSSAQSTKSSCLPIRAPPSLLVVRRRGGPQVSLTRPCFWDVNAYGMSLHAAGPGADAPPGNATSFRDTPLQAGPDGRAAPERRDLPAGRAGGALPPVHRLEAVTDDPRRVQHRGHLHPLQPVEEHLSDRPPTEAVVV